MGFRPVIVVRDSALKAAGTSEKGCLDDPKPFRYIGSWQPLRVHCKICTPTNKSGHAQRRARRNRALLSGLAMQHPGTTSQCEFSRSDVPANRRKDLLLHQRASPLSLVMILVIRDESARGLRLKARPHTPSCTSTPLFYQCGPGGGAGVTACADRIAAAWPDLSLNVAPALAVKVLASCWSESLCTRVPFAL